MIDFLITGVSSWPIQSVYELSNLPLNQSQNVLSSLTQSQSVSLSSLFILYVVVCILIKRPVFLLAFLLPELMFNLAIFDKFEGWQLNAIELVIYSYVFERCRTDKSKIACFIICYTALRFGIDDFFYGVNGYYGASETFIYENISLINSCAHVFFISTLISFSRIRNGLRDFFSSIMRSTATSDYMLIYWYNVSKIQ